MNLLNRYILKQFVKNILLLVLSFIALYILIDFFEKIDNFMEKGKPMALVAQFFLLSPPAFDVYELQLWGLFCR